jgi:DNA-binding MarR family transcriptional regulator
MQTNGGEVGTEADRAADELADAVLALLRGWRALTHRAAEAGAPSTVAVLELVRLLGEDERRLSEIALLRGVDQSVVSRQIHELQAKGLVCRRPDPVDRRASLIKLTPSGHELLVQVGELRREWLRSALASVPDTDMREATRLVAALATEITARATSPAADPAPSGRPSTTSTEDVPA